ncbi:SIFAR-like protein, partial [Mya arenaria]
WRYGAFLCKATPYLQGVSVCASVNFLAAIAADRYLAICYTLEHKMTWTIGKVIVCVIWLFSLCIMTPWALFYKLKAEVIQTQEFSFCYQEWPVENGESVFLLIVFISCYVIPLVLIIGCYFMIALRVSTRNAPGIFRYNNVIQKSKVKVIKMLVLIVLLFAISWLPLYIIFLVFAFNPPDPHSKTADILINVCVPIAQWLGNSNSCMNPIIYCFYSKTIRKRTVAMLSCSRNIEVRRRQSRYSSTRLMSVDYTNGQITLRLNKRRCESINFLPPKNGNYICESTFYD